MGEFEEVLDGEDGEQLLEFLSAYGISTEDIIIIDLESSQCKPIPFPIYEITLVRENANLVRMEFNLKLKMSHQILLRVS